MKQHKIIIRLTVIASVLMSVSLLYGVFYEYAAALHIDAFDFVWRWYGLAYIIAIATVFAVFVSLSRRVATRSGALIWFSLILCANVMYSSILLAQTLSANAATAAFWQGMAPLGWVTVPPLLLLFTLSFVDDVDVPRSVRLWVSVVSALVVLLFVTGMTNLMENHNPIHSALEWWGYQNVPGDYSSIIFIWASLLALLSLVMLIRAYRRAIDPLRKKQLKVFVVAFVQYIVIALVFDIILYIPFPHLMPSMAPIYLTVLAALIGHGIYSYGLFQITPSRLAEPILQNLSEAVLGVNLDCKIEFANGAVQKMFGRSGDQVHGVHLSDLLGIDVVDKQIRPLVQSQQDDIVIDELDLKDQQGNALVVAVNISRIIGEHNSTEGYIFTIQNITELKRKTIELAQKKAYIERRVVERTQQLHEEQAKLRASIDSLALGFLLVDVQGTVLLQNSALSRLIGQGTTIASIEDLSAMLHNVRLTDYCNEAIRAMKPKVIRDVGYQDKTWRIFITGVGATEGDGHSIGAVVLVEDITEAKVLERSRDEFFSIASHELRTPLTAIRGNSSMILEYLTDDAQNAEVRDAVGDIHDSSVRLISIVNDFLDLSRLEQGKVFFDYDEYEIDKIIESVVYEMKSGLKNKKITINYHGLTLGNMPKVWADATRVKQIVYNLLGNAIKFTDAGTITLAIVTEHDKIRVNVTDTGRGIPKEYQKYLFHKFQQAGNSLLTRDTTRGTGLGLYISRLMAREMGGDVWLENSKEFEGSTFSFTIPIATKEHKKRLASHKIKTIDVDTGLLAQA